MLLCSKPQTASLTVLTAHTATTAVVFVFLRLTLNVRAETHINRRPLFVAVVEQDPRASLLFFSGSRRFSYRGNRVFCESDSAQHGSSSGVFKCQLVAEGDESTS